MRILIQEVSHNEDLRRSETLYQAIEGFKSLSHNFQT